MSDPIESDEARTRQDAFAIAVAGLLRESRKRQRLTQGVVAERTGGVVSKAALANYEARHRSLRIDVFWILAKALGEDPGAIIATAERACGYGTAIEEGPVVVDVEVIRNSDDERLAPVQRWFAMRASTGGRPATTVTLDHGALAALAALMDIPVPDCRQLLLDAGGSGIANFAGRQAS